MEKTFENPREEWSYTGKFGINLVGNSGVPEILPNLDLIVSTTANSILVPRGTVRDGPGLTFSFNDAEFEIHRDSIRSIWKWKGEPEDASGDVPLWVNDSYREYSDPRRMLTPKFLTYESAKYLAVQPVLKMVFDSFGKQGLLGERKDCHIVIIVPGQRDRRAQNYIDALDDSVVPFILYRHSEGIQSEWRNPYNNIALCKALQLWSGRNGGHGVIEPQLLFPGETQYWGGVKVGGIVVACSGFQPWIDEMISGAIAHMLVGHAKHSWMTGTDKKSNLDFLV